MYLGGLRPKGEFFVDRKSLYLLVFNKKYRKEKSVFIHFAHIALLGFALVEKHLEKNKTRITVASNKCFEEKPSWEVGHYLKALPENHKL